MSRVNGLAYWAFLNKTDQFNNYSICLHINDSEKKNLTKEFGNDLIEKQVKPVDGQPGLHMLRLRRKSVKADGSEMPRVKVVDANLNPVPSNVLIGNGSEVNVTVSRYDYPATKTRKAGSRLSIGTVQIVKLIPYSSSADTAGLEKVSGGFTAPVTQESASDPVFDDTQEEELDQVKV